MNEQILWWEGDWRCELHAAASERAWLRLFEGDELMFVETVFVGKSASTRAEFLRTLFRGPHKTTKDMD